jgi:hypothetical protein
MSVFLLLLFTLESPTQREGQRTFALEGTQGALLLDMNDFLPVLCDLSNWVKHSLILAGCALSICVYVLKPL